MSEGGNGMITVSPIDLNGVQFTGVSVELPKTNLLAITNEVGYIMCAALDVDNFDANPKLAKREVIAARASGVRSLEDLLNAPLQKVTQAAKDKYGWTEGMIGKDALIRIS